MIDANDRGFTYGDGVFETIRVLRGEPVWWDAHLARLRHGCERLGIVCPDERELATTVRGEPVEPGPHGDGSTGSPRTGTAGSGVLKIVVTRGLGGRGYSPANAGTPTVVVTHHAAPAPLASVAVRWCDLRLSQQPRLAGIKHLNRLENVLARGEWSDPAIGEGLLRAGDGHVICATAANLFVVRDGRVVTPRLDRCGVAGVTRAWVMRQIEVSEGEIGTAEVEGADELFLTSSLRGILPVARLGGREWSVGPVTRHLQGLLPA